MANKKIILDCGVKAEYWTYQKSENLHISLVDLYAGFGELNNPLALSLLFEELHLKGYKLSGCSTVIGYYDSIEDLILHAIKN